MKPAKSLKALIVIFSLLLVACSTNDNEESNSEAEDPQAIDVEVTGESESSTSSVNPTESESDEGSTDQGDGEQERSFAGKLPAPEFPVGLDWLNTDRPLSLADLRGKVVLLDFWTYGCINCIHIIPDLKMLEEKYADELVVIGVHSAKFSNEGETENIRNIILRYELEHPVVNDREFQIWSQYGANAWPTLVLIDPEGKVLGYHSGEGIYEPFDAVISGMVKEFDALGRIDRRSLDLILENETQVESPLLFPGKVLADSDSDRLFIADSNHNRIVVTDMEGVVLEVIGDGRERMNDGDYESASFFRPQGMALVDEATLYVADTENHAIREIDLITRQVKTVAGTGEQVYMRTPEGKAKETALNSPWDVLFHDEKLYIAMAGQHQIWVYDPTEDILSVFAGSGREELKDGPLKSGGLNQPSGLATDGSVLFFADSEASAIRSASFNEEGQLETIVGTGLFDFGDVDGTGQDVRLQHPLGVAYEDGSLYVADTYNSKIKVIDPSNNESKTLLGGDESGWRDGLNPLFDEPGGLDFAEGRLVIADTNNHAIRFADLESGEVTTLVLVDLQGLLTRQPEDMPYTGKSLNLEPQSVLPGDGSIQLDVTLPQGYKMNDLAPFSMEWTASPDLIQIGDEQASQRIIEPTFPLEIPAHFSSGEADLSGDLIIYYCDNESASLCLIERLRVHLPVSINEDGRGDVLEVNHTIPEPEGFAGD